jgi:hypothetical protein
VNLLLHAITAADAVDAPPAGMRGQPLVRIEVEGIAAWASQFPDAPGQLTRADLMGHHELVTTLHERLNGAIPARLPTWLADGESLQRLLSDGRSDLAATLDRIHGKSEIALTAVWTAADEDLPEPEPGPEPEPATPGRRYLLGRQRALAGSDRKRRRSRELADQLEHLAGSELVEVRRQVCPSTTIALSAALLVPRASASRVKARLRRIEPDVRILVNGPWPPYSFVEIERSGEMHDDI